MNKLTLIALLSVPAFVAAANEVPPAPPVEGDKPKVEEVGRFTKAKNAVVDQFKAQYNDVKSVLGASYESKTRIATSLMIASAIVAIWEAGKYGVNYFFAAKPKEDTSKDQAIADALNGIAKTEAKAQVNKKK